MLAEQEESVERRTVNVASPSASERPISAFVSNARHLVPVQEAQRFALVSG
jgi:hypothetical protein